jgi:lipoprotein-anchoring transpeptidase ErfK/SrfK
MAIAIRLRQAALAAVAALTLSACVADPALIEAGLATPPEPRIESGAYVARQDGTFAIPAIPLEKLPTQYQRQTVYYPTDEVPGTVIVDPAQRHLYFVSGPNTAIRYGISVGKAGFEWAGVAQVTNRKPWPTWTPPPEMIERDPRLAKWEKGQPGGPTNPLGARALYLTTNGVDYGYRIHGTPDWQSIGRNASSGCIRMINQDIIDLYGRVPANAKVIVLASDGSVPQRLVLPPPAPKKLKAVPVAAPAPIALPPLPVLPRPAFTLPDAAAPVPAPVPSVDTAPADL